jgi:hypothetical protein
MDPNANLDEQLSLAESMIQAYNDPNSNGIDQDDANRLAEFVQALHSWISSGGFLPKQWEGDADTAINRVMTRSDVCTCKGGYPHRKATGCRR